MVNKTTTTNVIDNQIIIGDILLYSESKIVTIPITIESNSSGITKNQQPPIHRLSSNANTNAQALVPCDLKNTSPTNRTNERIKSSALSSKKLLRMPKAGLALAKEFKSKVVTSRMHTTNDDKHADDDEQTKL